MAHLPTELWFSIFELACVDGGLTGRTLALVSQHFRSMSEPARLFSVALTVGKRLSPLENLITSLAASDRLRRGLRHLFIEQTSILESNHSRDPDLEDLIPKRIHQLISLVAPTLFTLAIFTDELDWMTDLIPQIEYPALRDLTCAPYALMVTRVGKDGDQDWYMPVLQNAHLFQDHAGCEDAPSSLVDSAPRLTSLILSGYMDLRLAANLWVMLEWLRENTPQTNLVVGIVSLPYAGSGCGNANRQHQQKMDSLVALSETSNEFPRLVLLPEQDAWTADQMRKDWLPKVSITARSC